MHATEKNAYVAKATAELEALASRGVTMAGNAFSSIALLKGELTDADRATLLSGDDGRALHAALQSLGYAPEDWVGLATVAPDGAPLGPALLREVLVALDPATVVALDEPAAMLMREAYAPELACLPDFDEAMLEPGRVAHVLGMRVTNLGGFEAALADKNQKQVMWRRLKELPPLGEPY